MADNDQSNTVNPAGTPLVQSPAGPPSGPLQSAGSTADTVATAPSDPTVATPQTSSQPTAPTPSAAESPVASPPNVSDSTNSADPVSSTTTPATPNPPQTVPEAPEKPLSSVATGQPLGTPPSQPPASQTTDPQLSNTTFPDDLSAQWRRTKCLVCGYLHEGARAMEKCPKCGNQDPDKFEEAE